MKTRIPSVFAGALVISFALAASAGDKTQWQTGTLTDAKDTSYCRNVGFANSAGAAVGQVCQLTTHYIIETQDTIYEFNRTMTNRRDKPLVVTVKGPIKFSLGDSPQLQDDNGKGHGVVLVRKILKTPPQPPKQH